jgi:hypothetical protein
MKLKFTILAALFAQAAMAQLKLPQVSAAAEVEQTVGYTKIDVEYSRPNLNKRTAFGSELVPFGKIWRTGANTNTKFEIDSDVQINGKPLQKGTYAIFTVPNKQSWDVVFYTKTDNWGAPEKFEDDLVALKLSVPAQKTAEKVESFTIGFKDVSIEKATMFLAWENTQVNLNITTDAMKVAQETIQNELNDGSSARDYFSAAAFYYNNKLDMKRALEWINTAIQKDPNTAYFKDYKMKIEAALKK